MSAINKVIIKIEGKKNCNGENTINCKAGRGKEEYYR